MLIPLNFYLYSSKNGYYRKQSGLDGKEIFGEFRTSTLQHKQKQRLRKIEVTFLMIDRASRKRATRRTPFKPVTIRQFFRSFVETHLDSAPSEMKTLSLTHGTKAVYLRDILACGEIKLPPDNCRTLNDCLIFTFYGRPSYRVNENAGALKRTAGAPTYLLLKPKAFEVAAMAHPVDTGAFKLSLYEAHIDKAFDPRDFGFKPNPENIKKIIYYFFGSNESYMDNLPRERLNVPDGQDEAQAYYDLITNKVGIFGDERDSSIEVSLSRNIPLNPEWIECIVMPNLLADVGSYGHVCNNLGIKIRTYRFTRGLSSKDHTGRIFDSVLDFYREKQML
jgi:hypothetical protein